MRRSMSTILAAAALALGLAAAGGAQEITVYRDSGFSGPARAFGTDNPDPRMGFLVNSARVRGGAWELCSGVGFRGTCITVDRNVANLRSAYGWPGPLNSIRRIGGPQAQPLPAPTPAPLPLPGRPPAGAGNSLRGMAAEFFPAPMLSGRRVEACRRGNATPECARRTAEDFCRAAGWAYASHVLMETERGRVYLADVLCTRSGLG